MHQEYLQCCFLVPIIAIGVSASLHATGYLHGDGKRRQGWFWLYLIGTLLSMVGVVLAPTKLAFLVAWEAMGLFSSGLVGFESATAESKKATWIYLMACHAGAVFLILSGVMTIRMDVNWIVVWYLALVGFGLKIGFPPFHVWLPEAHPAAPAPASAVMSGAMIPLGFYGLATWIPQDMPELMPHIAWSLLILGSLAAFGGILFSLPQKNIKKLLAFSSVENMGVISIGFALAAFAVNHDCSDSVLELAYAGAMLHVLNHAFIKGGLFLGAGSVLRMTGTLDSDRLGGLMKRMPWTGTLFTLNAFGLSGLPPLPAFLSEFCIYAAAIQALSNHEMMLPASIVLIVMAVTGGIATASYAKIVSATFLGASRSDGENVKETPKRMIIAQLILFVPSAIMMLPVAIVVVIVFLLRRFLLPRGKTNPNGLTWDCGYERPTARMAWTGTAFAQPLADTFSSILAPRKHIIRHKGVFPGDSAIVTETDDIGIARFWGPIFHSVARIFQRVHLLQNGSLHFYVSMMIAAIIILLIWGALA